MYEIFTHFSHSLMFHPPLVFSLHLKPKSHIIVMTYARSSRSNYDEEWEKTKDIFTIFLSRERGRRASPYTWHEQNIYGICSARWIVHVSESNSILNDMMNGLKTEAARQLESEEKENDSISRKDFRGILSHFRLLLKYQTFHLIWFRNEQYHPEVAGGKGLRLKDLLASLRYNNNNTHNTTMCHGVEDDENVKAINQI